MVEEALNYNSNCRYNSDSDCLDSNSIDSYYCSIVNKLIKKQLNFAINHCSISSSINFVKHYFDYNEIH